MMIAFVVLQDDGMIEVGVGGERISVTRCRRRHRRPLWPADGRGRTPVALPGRKRSGFRGVAAFFPDWSKAGDCMAVVAVVV